MNPSRFFLSAALTALLPAVPAVAAPDAPPERIYRCAGTGGTATVQAMPCGSATVHQQIRPLTPADRNGAAPTAGVRQEIALQGRAPGPCQIVLPQLPEVISVAAPTTPRPHDRAGTSVGWVDVPLQAGDNALPPCPAPPPR